MVSWPFVLTKAWLGKAIDIATYLRVGPTQECAPAEASSSPAAEHDSRDRHDAGTNADITELVRPADLGGLGGDPELHVLGSQ